VPSKISSAIALNQGLTAQKHRQALFFGAALAPVPHGFGEQLE
jgi:hypothetical protein